MKLFERIFKLHRLLRQSRYPVKWQRILDELKCSNSTARRVMKELRESLGAPIEVTEDPQGYRYTDDTYELPGLWFSATELQSLFMLHLLLQTFEPGLLGNVLSPFLRRLEQILGSQGLATSGGKRIRLLRVASRPAGPFFGDVASALLQRHRMTIHYRAPNVQRATPREISPLRMSHYRDKWYLDAWCHKQNGLRTFALHRIQMATVLGTAAIEMDEARLDRELGSSYGIFAGEPVAVAKLLFSPKRADYVEGEQWHPDQKASRLKSGEYLLEIPYSASNELILDILHYGPDVEVLAPMELREAVADQLWVAAQQYRKSTRKRAV